MRDLPKPTVDTPSMLHLLAAFERLDADSTRRWGTMSPAQMARHCRLFCELCLGQVPVTAPIRWLARLLGPWFLRRMLAKSPTEAPKNLTTLSPLRADPTTELELDEEKVHLVAALDAIAALAGDHRHPLYGSMRAIDVQSLVRHHTAHHCNQFGLLTWA
jgi:hypothetical protein